MAERLLTAPGVISLQVYPRGEGYSLGSHRPIVHASLGRDEVWQPAITLQFADPASFHRFTSRHINQRLGIYLDGNEIASPEITAPLSDSVQITGERNGGDVLNVCKHREFGAPSGRGEIPGSSIGALAISFFLIGEPLEHASVGERVTLFCCNPVIVCLRQFVGLRANAGHVVTAQRGEGASRAYWSHFRIGTTRIEPAKRKASEKSGQHKKAH